MLIVGINSYAENSACDLDMTFYESYTRISASSANVFESERVVAEERQLEKVGICNLILSCNLHIDFSNVLPQLKRLKQSWLWIVNFISRKAFDHDHEEWGWPLKSSTCSADESAAAAVRQQIRLKICCKRIKTKRAKGDNAQDTAA